MTIGGAGAGGLPDSSLIMIGPGSGAAGGFKYLTATSWQYSTFLHDFWPAWALYGTDT